MHWVLALVVLLSIGVLPALGQIDPVRRALVQMGYNQPLEGRGPIAGYAYVFINRPEFPTENQTLRLALAPVYADAELGFHKLLGPWTDLAVGVAGGGFADSFSEIRRGRFLRDESFTGHGGEISSSIYHRLNPTQLIPLNAVFRSTVHYSTYEPDDRTAANFELPDDRTSLVFRSGLRWGGREPMVFPDVALELSIWYEGQIRDDAESYGFAEDRRVRGSTHLVWGRALFIYTLPELRHSFSLNLTTGTSLAADRFGAYRLGAALPLASEFPLNLPGYYFQEITARKFVSLGGQYVLPLSPSKRWGLTVFGTTALVEYLPGFEQPGNWHTGVGGGLTYQPASGIWQASLGYARGIDAIRDGGRGANSVGFVVQFDIEAQVKSYGPLLDPSMLLDRLRGVQRLFGR